MTLDTLAPDFRARIEPVLASLAEHGHVLRPYSTLRDPFSQARLWRQSRSSQEIKTMCARLRAIGAPRIAACIEEVGPQHGKPVTNALPGWSMHQWGWAVDCFVLVDGRAEWDAAHPGYVAYAKAATEAGLKAGRDFGDSPHVQLYQWEIPARYKAPEIEAAMVDRYPAFRALGI